MKGNILITGAGGFIGSHLAEQCVRDGCKVRVFLHYNSNNHWGWLEESDLKNDMEVILGDIRDYDSVLEAVKGCSTIFHLAALIGIPYSYVSPLAYVRTNVEGTYNVLQAARKEGVQNILITSTSETYGTAQYTPIDEKHPLVGQSPYSASKISADQFGISFHRSFGLAVKIVRPFNTYGPRQSTRAIIPTVITQILNGKNKIHLGNTRPTRDLTFVEDTVKGFLAIADCNALTGEVTNIGNNSEISIGDLALKIAQVMGETITIEEDEKRIRPQNSEVEQLRCDNSKIKKLTGWKPSVSLEDGLKRTVSWIRENEERYKAGVYHV